MDMCEYRSACAFYTELKERRPLTLESIKEEYCDGNYSGCARFMVYKTHGPYNVSKYLFPEDIHEACKILDDLN